MFVAAMQCLQPSSLGPIMPRVDSAYATRFDTRSALAEYHLI